MFGFPFDHTLFPGFGIIGIILLIFSIIVGILWSILPFAIFGIKPKLDKIIQLLEEINKKLK